MQTLTELYNSNTMEFAYESHGIDLVANHKVSYKTMQALGRIMTNMQISQEGAVKANEMLETLMGHPSEATRVTLIKGLGRNYNAIEVQREVTNRVKEEAAIPEDEIALAVNTLMLALEDEITTALFSAYLENQEKSSDTPR